MGKRECPESSKLLHAVDRLDVVIAEIEHLHSLEVLGEYVDDFHKLLND